MAFCGHDESEQSLNQGNLIELLKFLFEHNEEINKVVLNNTPKNLKLTSPRIQKDIIIAAAIKTTTAIARDIGDELFSILVDGARNISVKEQMVVALRFVDREGSAIERIIGVEHIINTSSLSLKAAIKSLFSRDMGSVYQACMDKIMMELIICKKN